MKENQALPKLKPSFKSNVPMRNLYARDDDEMTVTISLGRNHYNSFYPDQLREGRKNTAWITDDSDDDCSFELT